MIGENLKELRARTGESQAVMANRIGLGLRAYQDLENAAVEFRGVHRQAANFASIEIAAQYQEPELMTHAALQAVVNIEDFITPDLRARVRNAPVTIVLTPVERLALDALERAMDVKLTAFQVETFAREMRATKR